MSKKNTTEDYSERINVSDDFFPHWVDRLAVNKVDFGYSLFDRKTKKQLIARKSKADCELGETLLLDGNESEFKSFVKTLENKPVGKPKIYSFYMGHVTRYFTVNSYEQLKKVCLHMLKEKIKYGELKEIPVPAELDFSLADIKKFPHSLRSKASDIYTKRQEQLKFIRENNKMYEEAVKAIDEKNGDAAWNLIQIRKQFGTEDFTVIKPIDL